MQVYIFIFTASGDFATNEFQHSTQIATYHAKIHKRWKPLIWLGSYPDIGQTIFINKCYVALEIESIKSIEHREKKSKFLMFSKVAITFDFEA